MRELDAAAIAAAAPWQEAMGLGFIGLGSAAFAGALLTIIFTRSLFKARQQSLCRKRSAQAPAYLDVAFLDALASSTPPARVAALYRAMTRDFRGRIDGIRAAARSGDLDRVQTESEALAESCEAFGATGLALQARALLVAVRDRAFDDAAQTLLEIDVVARRTYDALADRAAV